MNRFLLAGYYGYRNWGDEGSLATLLQVLPPSQCVVLSGDPAFSEKTYGVHALPRMDLRAVRQAIQQTDALILGGGSLLQDATSLRSLLYYLTLIHWGLKAHGQVWLVGQGVGPLRRPISRWLTAKVLNRVPFISLRDEESAQLLRAIGVRAPLRVAADLTWALRPSKPHWHLPTERPCVGLAPRTWDDAPVEPAFIALCEHLHTQGYTPLLIPMQESQDRALCEAIAQATGALLVPAPNHPAHLMGLMAHLEAMVAVRLHGAIFALAQDVPTLCIIYDPKVRALAEQVGMPTLSLDATLPEQLPRAWAVFDSQRADRRSSLHEHTQILKQKTHALLYQLAEHISKYSTSS
ncbi:MAG: polysaccharide pyruvyl transferase CsaB [Fimbriimonadales bacterium]